MEGTGGPLDDCGVSVSSAQDSVSHRGDPATTADWTTATHCSAVDKRLRRPQPASKKNKKKEEEEEKQKEMEKNKKSSTAALTNQRGHHYQKQQPVSCSVTER